MYSEISKLPKIDLHMHSVVSDGSDSPEELAQLVREKGIDIFSLTDHDAVKGCGRIRQALKPGGPKLLTGVEFSCKDHGGKYHILGYGYDPEGGSIRKTVEKGHELRMKNVWARLQLLEKEFGFAFRQEEIDQLLSLDNPGKPHIANLMVKYGYAENRTQAIREFIDKLSYKSLYLNPEETIMGILNSGGIPILAHPAYGSGSEMILGRDLEKRVLHLIHFGLKGLEAVYNGFTPAIRNEALGLAKEYDLYVTAGSDYHGGNKVVVLGETGLKELDTVPEGLNRFLEDISGKLY